MIPANAPRIRIVLPGTREAQVYELGLDALALKDYSSGGAYTIRQLYAVSAYGPGSTVKAFAAALSNGRRVPGQMSAWGMGGLFAKDSIWAGDQGFTVYQHRLGYDTWHMLALRKEPGLLPNFSQREIARQLMSDRFTTPILPHWVPYVASKLVLMNRLMRLRCFGACDAGLISAEGKHIDAIVSAGIRAGELTFQREELSDA